VKGILLVNLGSPDSPSVPDVRRYLREFLMDGRVLDVNWFVRFCVVHFAILPARPKESAHAYQKIWTTEGSPLVTTSKDVHSKLQQRVNAPVELAMRYQHPSIPAAIGNLVQRGVDDLLLIPLFPHYAMSSFETAVERVKEVAASVSPGMRVAVQPPFYADHDYIHALVVNATPYLDKGFDHLLFSYHGLPERQLRKTDPTGCHCLATPNCCETPSPAHATCYRAQCFRTTAEFVKKARISSDKYSISFQSRLGRDPWLKPYTDFEIPRLVKQGVKRMLVICPAFVSDCLETLEEIGMRARESFVAEGGSEFALIPCLNEHPLWLETLERMAKAFLAPENPASNSVRSDLSMSTPEENLKLQ
jgi:protoporphyrin/coproporphyrin ferrochelatase